MICGNSLQRNRTKFQSWMKIIRQQSSTKKMTTFRQTKSEDFDYTPQFSISIGSVSTALSTIRLRTETARRIASLATELGQSIHITGAAESVAAFPKISPLLSELVLRAKLHIDLSSNVSVVTKCSARFS